MSEAIRWIINRLALLVGRGFVGAANDAGNLQVLQVKLGASETRDGIPRIGEYGHASMPPIDGNAVAVVLFVNGERGNGVVIATEHLPSRLKNMQPGESAMHDDLGQYVYITRNGIVIDGAGKTMTIQNVGTLQVDGAISATGDIASTGGNLKDSTGKSLADARSVFNPHTHTDPQGGTTGTPSGSM